MLRRGARGEHGVGLSDVRLLPGKQGRLRAGSCQCRVDEEEGPGKADVNTGLLLAAALVLFLVPPIFLGGGKGGGSATPARPPTSSW